MTKLLSQEHRGEILCLLMLGATGVALLVGAASLPAPMFDPLGPAGLPRYIAYLLLALVVIRLIVLTREATATVPGRDDNTGADTRNLLGAGERGIPRAEIREAPQYLRLIAVATITLIYVGVLASKTVPFVWVTLAYLAGIGAAMSDLSPRKLVTVGCIAVVMSVGLTYVFSEVLSVVLPQ